MFMHMTSHSTDTQDGFSCV